MGLRVSRCQSLKDLRLAVCNPYEYLPIDLTKVVLWLGADSQRLEIYKWLEQTDPSLRHNIARSLHTEGTAEWIFRHPDWSCWLQGQQNCLWIHGIPGAGKTLLASQVIEFLEGHCESHNRQPTGGRVASAYYYCYFGHQQNEAAPFLRWLISQLGRAQESVPPQAYAIFRRGRQPRLSELLVLLEEVLEGLDSAYVVIDAVDESETREDLLRILQTFATDSRFHKLRLLVTSRGYVDIETTMERFSVGISMSNSHLENDIRRCVMEEIARHAKFRMWPKRLLDEVVDVVPRKAHGMFRWAVCQLFCLQKLRHENYVIHEALKNLPKDLDETYERIFLAIPAEDAQAVHHVLQWIYFHQASYRGGVPSTVVLESLAKSRHADSRNRLYDQDALREICGCLVTISTSRPFPGRNNRLRTPVLSFAHYTVKEFLESDRISNNPASAFALSPILAGRPILNLIFTQALSPLSKFCSGDCVHRDCTRDVAVASLSNYCAVTALVLLYEGDEFYEFTTCDELVDMALKLMDPSRTHFQHLHPVDAHINESFRAPPFIITVGGDNFYSAEVSESTPSRIASLLYLLYMKADIALAQRLLACEPTWESLLRQELSVTAEISRFGKFPQRYSYTGQLTSFIALLDRYHYPEFILLLSYLQPSAAEASALLAQHIGFHGCDSCQEESFCAVRECLDRGADPNGKDFGVSPLQIAAAFWDAPGVEMLLSAGADPNNTGSSSRPEWTNHPSVKRFSRLQGSSPLLICRSESKWRIARGWRIASVGAKAKVESLLLEYGAVELGSPYEDSETESGGSELDLLPDSSACSDEDVQVRM